VRARAGLRHRGAGDVEGPVPEVVIDVKRRDAEVEYQRGRSQ
jgi:hypothetical protein